MASSAADRVTVTEFPSLMVTVSATGRFMGSNVIALDTTLNPIRLASLLGTVGSSRAVSMMNGMRRAASRSDPSFAERGSFYSPEKSPRAIDRHQNQIPGHEETASPACVDEENETANQNGYCAESQGRPGEYLHPARETHQTNRANDGPRDQPEVALDTQHERALKGQPDWSQRLNLWFSFPMRVAFPAAGRALGGP